MNKRKSLILGALLAVALSVNAQQISPLKQAVINSYSDLIAQNPQDYMSYFQRGTEYYNLGDFARAEADLLQAIKFTPEKDTSFLDKEYALLVETYLQSNQNEKALSALGDALKAVPNSYVNRYKLGNVYLALGKPEEAYTMFRSLQNLKSRSQEAFYGMALAASALGRTEEVEKLLQEVKNSDLNSPLTYERVGRLYEELGQNVNAASNYIVAYHMSENSSSPIESLIALSLKDYSSVISVLDSLIESEPSDAATRFLKASIAFRNEDYNTAVKECREILKNEEAQQPFVYSLLAQSELYSGDTAMAMNDINKAASLAPKDLSVLLTQSEILMSTDPSLAVKIAGNALKIDPENLDAIMNAAKANYMVGNGPEALKLLNEAVMTDPSNVEAVVLRGDVNTNLLKDSKQGQADYTRAGNIDATDSFNKVLKALAKARASKPMDAESIITGIVNGDPDADDLYYVACYYAQTGNLNKAKEMADKAVTKGYKNRFYLQSSSAPVLNLKPIHSMIK